MVMDQQKKERPVRWWLLLLLAFGAAALVSGKLVFAVRIVGNSMSPTLEKNDWVLADPVAYRDDSPEFGDVVIFRKREVTDEILVKRIIGIPGDTVEIRDGRVYVDGKALEEPLPACPQDFSEINVPPGSFFVLGDNRAESRDSRFWEDPFVEGSAVVGKVVYQLYPKLKNLK